MTTDSPVKKKRTPYTHLFRLSHWILAAGMLFLILTGYGIHAVSMPSWSILEKYPSFYPTLRTIHWHKLAGIVFAPASIIILISFLPKIRTLRTSRLRKITNIILIGSGCVCALTSIGLIYSNIPASLYLTFRFLHAFFGMVVAPVSLLVHLFLALFKYFRLIVPSFAPLRQPRWTRAGWLVLGLALSWILFTRFIPDSFDWNQLTAHKVDTVFHLPGQADQLPWETAEPLQVQLVNGVGFHTGITTADLRAFHNEQYLYMKIEWDDPIYNRLYRPWIKTETGWMHLNPGGSDEQIYNEDKMALLFPVHPDKDFQRFGCSVYCHNNESNGFGMHWTPEDSIVDVWHWKSVRTDPAGYVDDKYWLGSGVLTPESEGRHGDPGESGYANNLVSGIGNPIMLPNSLDSILMGALVLSKSGIYTKTAADALPVGSAVPGIIISQPEGDRADIRCRSRYSEGLWTVYIVRKLDTGSPYDVAFLPGGEYDFALTTFDHSSFRHAYNNQSYRLVLEP